MARPHRNTTLRFFIGKLMLGIGSACFVAPGQAAPGIRSEGPVSRSVTPTKQAADRLVAMTKPGYYKALLVPDWRAKQTASARSAAGSPCNRVCPQTGSASKSVQFSGERLDEKQVRLTWTPGEAGTIDNIGIERTLNPADGFETVATLKGSAMASPAVAYQTIDPNSHTGYTYYRLKQVDMTGAFTYSQIIAIKGELPPLTVRAFPNPGQQKNILFQVGGLNDAASVSVALYDLQGRVLYQNEQVVPDADRRLTLPSSLGLQPGSYFLKLSANDQHTSTSFILQP